MNDLPAKGGPKIFVKGPMPICTRMINSLRLRTLRHRRMYWYWVVTLTFLLSHIALLPAVEQNKIPSDEKEIFKYVLDNCSLNTDTKGKIFNCERMAADNRFNKWLATIYVALSNAYYDVKNIDQAIKYKKLAIASWGSNFDPQDLSTELKRKLYVQHFESLSYQKYSLGTLTYLKASHLSLAGRESEAFAYANAAVAEYSSAISANQLNDSAFAHRADVYSWLCEPQEAEYDMNIAIKIVKQKHDLDKIAEYESKRLYLRTCNNNFRYIIKK